MRRVTAVESFIQFMISFYPGGWSDNRQQAIVKLAVPVGSQQYQSVVGVNTNVSCLLPIACFGLFSGKLPERFLEAGAGEGGDLVNGTVGNDVAVVNYDNTAADGFNLLHDMG